MENASKALIMAAGVLIGILILSLAAYLYVDFGSSAAKINSQMEEQQISQFNSKFTSYEGQKGLTIYDVITVASHARENNLYYQDNLEGHEILIVLKQSALRREIQGITQEGIIELINKDKELINEDNSKLPTYNCEVIDYHPNGRVYKIEFTRND